jgi:hypothetical protein
MCRHEPACLDIVFLPQLEEPIYPDSRAEYASGHVGHTSRTPVLCVDPCGFSIITFQWTIRLRDAPPTNGVDIDTVANEDTLAHI